MRKLNREKTKREAQNILTKEDIKKALSDNSVDLFDLMLNTGVYEYKVKRYLYETGKLSVRGLLLNDDMYVLSLGKKEDDGTIMIDNGILALFDRFLMAKKCAEAGDTTTALLIDFSDTLYDVILKDKENKGTDKQLTKEEYVGIFNTAYTQVTSSVLDQEVMHYIESDKALKDEYIRIKNKK